MGGGGETEDGTIYTMYIYIYIYTLSFIELYTIIDYNIIIKLYTYYI